MPVTLALPIEMCGGRIGPRLSGGPPSYKAMVTETEIDPADYDGLVGARFEVVATFDSSDLLEDRRIQLVDADDNVYATLNFANSASAPHLPTETSNSGRGRRLTAEITLAPAATRYYLNFPDVHISLSTSSARIWLILEDSSKFRSSIPIHDGNTQNFGRDVFAYGVQGSSPTYLSPAEDLPGQKHCHVFARTANWDRIASWTWEVIGAVWRDFEEVGEGIPLGRAALFDKDTDAMVEGSEIEFVFDGNENEDPAPFERKSVTLAESSLTAGHEFELRLQIDNGPTGRMLMYRARLYANVEDAASAEVYCKVGSNTDFGTIDAVIMGSRQLFDPGLFPGATWFFESTGRQTVEDGPAGMTLLKVYSADDGIRETVIPGLLHDMINQCHVAGDLVSFSDLPNVLARDGNPATVTLGPDELSNVPGAAFFLYNLDWEASGPLVDEDYVSDIRVFATVAYQRTQNENGGIRMRVDCHVDYAACVDEVPDPCLVGDPEAPFWWFTGHRAGDGGQLEVGLGFQTFAGATGITYRRVNRSVIHKWQTLVSLLAHNRDPENPAAIYWCTPNAEDRVNLTAVRVDPRQPTNALDTGTYHIDWVSLEFESGKDVVTLHFSHDAIERKRAAVTPESDARYIVRMSGWKTGYVKTLTGDILAKLGPSFLVAVVGGVVEPPGNGDVCPPCIRVIPECVPRGISAIECSPRTVPVC